MAGISEVKTNKQLKLFEQLPELIHKKDPYFVPPFPGSVCKLIGPKGPFQKKHGQVFPFLYYQDGKPVGRIAAIINRSHNEFHQDRVGFFGFFDLIDDEAVGRALLSAARAKLKEHGFTSMRGPYNPSINDEIGLLTQGFESAPFLMMTYNPPYYLSLYEKLGLQMARSMVAFYLNSSEEPPPRIHKIVDRIRKSSGVKVRSIQMAKLKEELKIVHRLYNMTLDKNWGFVPIKYEDLEVAASDLKQIVDPNLILIAEKDGEPIGFSLCFPNVNEFMWKTKNNSTLMRMLKFLWLLKTSQPKEARLAVLGVHPDYRNLGLGALFYFETLMRARARKYIGGEMSWCDEGNEDIIRGITLMGGKPYKQYQIFETAL